MQSHLGPLDAIGYCDAAVCGSQVRGSFCQNVMHALLVLCKYRDIGHGNVPGLVVLGALRVLVILSGKVTPNTIGVRASIYGLTVSLID